MLKLIKTNQQYDDALERTYNLMQINLLADSKASDELEILSILIKQYEHEHFSVPKPVKAI